MGYDQTRRSTVRSCYVDKGQSLEAISRNTGVSTATVRRWRKADAGTAMDWDKARRMSVESPYTDAMAKTLVSLVEWQNSILRDMDATKDLSPAEKADIATKLSDAVVKASAAINRVTTPKMNLKSVSDFVTDFGMHLATHHMEIAPPYMDVLDQFAPIWIRENL